MPKESYCYLAQAFEGAPDPFSLAYIAQVEVGLFVLDDSNVMNVLVETEQRATSEGLSSAQCRREGRRRVSSRRIQELQTLELVDCYSVDAWLVG